MAFVKKIWTDRIAEYINRRTLTKEDGSTELVTVARSEGTVSQEGDAFNADNMNDLEERVANEFNALNSSLTKQGSYELLTSCYTATSYEVPNISKFKSIYVALIMTSTNICADDTFMPVSIFKLGKTRQLNINYETYKYGNIQYVDDTTIKVSDISDGMYLTVWGVY